LTARLETIEKHLADPSHGHSHHGDKKAGGKKETKEEVKAYEKGHFHYEDCPNDTEALKDKTNCNCATHTREHMSALQKLSQESFQKEDSKENKSKKK